MAAAEFPSVGGILLAAGGSRRMGSPKQLAEFQGVPLIRRSADALSASLCDPCVVVLGAESDRCRQQLAGLALDIVVNEAWPSGMSSSIKAGLERVTELLPGVGAAAIMLCDQPLITSEILDRLVAEYRRIRSAIVASEYNGVVGVPALFSREVFDELRGLGGDQGAREVIRHSADRVTAIPVPEGAFDVDSPADLDRIKKIIK